MYTRTPLVATACAILTAALAPSANAQAFDAVGIRAQGMGGAFVAVADDATATWWNPAGLAAGAYFNATFEYGRLVPPADGTVGVDRFRGGGIALALPSLGLSFYRTALPAPSVASSTAGTPAGRQEESSLSTLGVTVGQSVGDHLVVATTAKLLRGAGASTSTLDVGALARAGVLRAGISVRDVTRPALGEGANLVELPRVARAGVAVSDAAERIRVDFDADLTTTRDWPPAEGGVGAEVRHAALGGEVWAPSKRFGLRAGVSWNTVGDARRTGSVGASIALRSGGYLEGQLTGGSDLSRRGWSIGTRVTF